jgi:F-type H+-transporting ATPase subunit gamma
MANTRAIVKRRKAIRNIRKITRTMELIATARFKRAMDRATQAEAYTRKIAELVTDLSQSGLEIAHPLLAVREETKHGLLLAICSNRGLCGGYNANLLRAAARRLGHLKEAIASMRLEVSGKRGLAYFRFRGVKPDEVFTHFEDRPSFDEVEVLADRYLEWYVSGRVDRIDVAYTRFISTSRQEVNIETLLPLKGADGAASDSHEGSGGTSAAPPTQYEFLPDAAGILEEILPVSFKVRLFKCFLDAAVSEQISRMVAMKGATENADEIIRQLSMKYNRARQAQITKEISEIIGGAESLK